MKNSVSLFGHNWREYANMSNVERSYNTSRRIRKGFKAMLNSLDWERSLRRNTNVEADEFWVESFLSKKIIPKYDRTLNWHKFVGREY